MSRNTVIATCVTVACVLVLWLLANPLGRFGKCGFAYTTYGSIPRIATDLQVRSDGKVRKVEKTHSLGYQQVEWLLTPLPQTLIISTGWNEKVEVDEQLSVSLPCEVLLLRTGEAIRKYNELKKAGRKVAIHLHSTC